MTKRDDETQVACRPYFRAVLTPHRSLPPFGFLLLMAGISAVSFAAGLWFALAGAWPVLVFFGLDVLLIYVAFRVSYRSGRAAEIVQIDSHVLSIVRLDPEGRERERVDFNPYWVRVGLTTLADGRNELALSSHGRSVVLGGFLTDDERESLATAMRAAIAASGRPA